MAPNGDDPTRALTLANEAMKTFDVESAAAHLSAAIRGFTAAGDRRQAATASARLGDLFAVAMGNVDDPADLLAKAELD